MYSEVTIDSGAEERFTLTTRKAWQNISNEEQFPRERIVMPIEAQPINRFVVRASSWVLLRAFGHQGAVTDAGYEITGVPAFHRVYHTLEPWHPSTLMTMPFLYASLRASEPNWGASARRARDLFDAPLRAGKPQISSAGPALGGSSL